MQEIVAGPQRKKIIPAAMQKTFISELDSLKDYANELSEIISYWLLPRQMFVVIFCSVH